MHLQLEISDISTKIPGGILFHMYVCVVKSIEKLTAMEYTYKPIIEYPLLIRNISEEEMQTTGNKQSREKGDHSGTRFDLCTVYGPIRQHCNVSVQLL